MPRKTNLTVLNMELGVQLSGVRARHRDNGKVTASLIILDKSTLEILSNTVSFPSRRAAQ